MARFYAPTDKQLALLVGDLRHPSLRAKKYDEARDIWQGRVNASWRFYFKIQADAYPLFDLIPHPK
jgi:mRNA interferase RelE/StbE